VGAKEAKNLDTATETKTVAGEGKLQDLRGALTIYMAKSSQQGLGQVTIQKRVTTLETLSKREGADLNEPLSVWQAIEKQNWKDNTKQGAAEAYKHFCRVFKIVIPEGLNFNKWQTREPDLPYVPLTSEVESLIASCNMKTSIFLLLLAETGIRSGEAWRLKWSDFDFERRILTLNDTEKRGKKRQFKLSERLSNMIQVMPKKTLTVWNGDLNNFRISFGAQKRRLAAKLQNPRLRQIHFHSLRHYFACMLYHKTNNLVLVQERLGHRSILNTMIYTRLIQWDSEDYATATASTFQEAQKLCEAGWEKWDDMDGIHIYRKRK
jgi:integrase